MIKVYISKDGWVTDIKELALDNCTFENAVNYPQANGLALTDSELEQLKVKVAKSIFAGFCMTSKDMKEKETLCRVISKVVPEIRLDWQEKKKEIEK